jgi:hypothetical protein
MTRSRLVYALAFALACVSSSAAYALDAAFAGRWVIAGAVIAPWADPQQAGGPAEEKRLVGQTVTFGPTAVVGPPPLGCPHAAYTQHDDPPDMLYEGGLAEPDAHGKPRDAVALAHSLGLIGPTAHTLETGGRCSEIAYHLLAPGVLSFGLNNRVYTLNRPQR